MKALGLEARAVTYRASARSIVDGVSLAVEPGCLLAMLGPNGAGKSTLLKLLAGDLRPTAGEALLDGRQLRTYTPAELARRRAVLPQSTLLSFSFSSLDVALMGRYPHLGPGGETAHDIAVARAALARADALDLADRRYLTLSGGEQQRVNLARVLAQETPILLLDEPTAHLDPRHQSAALRVARELAASGCAVLAVLHDVNLAAAHADRVALLADSRLVAVGDPWQVLTPERLEAVYGLPFGLVRHPFLDCPLLVPRPAQPAAA
jgi:iron complex transport system ATP-binding protein